MEQNKGFSQIALIVIAVVVILGVVSVLAAKKLNLTSKTAPTPVAQVKQDSVLTALGKQSNSDEVGAIDQDINTTNLDNLDTDLNQVDQDLNNL